jgi:hypothetical protein
VTTLGKTIALFLSVLLVFTSISTVGYSTLLATDLKIPGEQPIVSWTHNAGNTFVIFNGPGEKSLTPSKGVPETNSKYQPYDFIKDSLFYGIRKYISSSRNISFSSSVDCSLPGCVIVFPFHNFW